MKREETRTTGQEEAGTVERENTEIVKKEEAGTVEREKAETVKLEEAGTENQAGGDNPPAVRRADTGSVRPADTGSVRPADTGSVRPADTGSVRPADTGSVRKADKGGVGQADTGKGQRKRERMRPTNAFYVVAHTLIGIYLRLVYPVTVEGREKLPRHKVLLCPNHSSNWDPLIIATRLPLNYRLHAMAKKELFQNPILGWILRQLGVFPVNREGTDIKAVKTAIQVLQDGDNLMIFPEGTVIINGIGYADGLPAHAKSGAAMIGIRTGATLVPVFVDGPKKPFRRTRLIFGDPYVPKITGRKGTAEEVQKAADDILAAAYALGGQAVGGTRLLNAENPQSSADDPQSKGDTAS